MNWTHSLGKIGVIYSIQEQRDFLIELHTPIHTLHPHRHNMYIVVCTLKHEKLTGYIKRM